MSNVLGFIASAIAVAFMLALQAMWLAGMIALGFFLLRWVGVL